VKHRELYALVIGFILAILFSRILEGDWTTVAAIVVGLVPFIQDLRNAAHSEADTDDDGDNESEG
jgi:general stress protein CsbA